MSGDDESMSGDEREQTELLTIVSERQPTTLQQLMTAPQQPMVAPQLVYLARQVDVSTFYGDDPAHADAFAEDVERAWDAVHNKVPWWNNISGTLQQLQTLDIPRPVSTSWANHPLYRHSAYSTNNDRIWGLWTGISGTTGTTGLPMDLEQWLENQVPSNGVTQARWGD